ncbi:MAG TPA: hypothetical protein PKY77_25305 [Phycisphaerae bacterium]|nr:hypothetical protein [Phycisphaerae bacterium]HRY66781.1 hypothetical protein [Phycisphaerae bacterium]HSA28421.1 hypothetical protein [Phycisphaerae bacterium]
MRFAKYLKVAFLNRWNLLVTAGAMGFAMLSGQADIWVPLVVAGEVTYLGLLASHSRFQAYVDAHEAKVFRQQGTDTAQQTYRTIIQSLPPKSVERFRLLRSQCLELRQIAQQLKGPEAVEPAAILEESQGAGLDRLLWIYLRMLYTQYSIERFLQKTSEAQIQRDIASLEERLKAVTGVSDEVQRQRFAKALEDSLQTSRDRLANYQKAKANCELVQLELERLENKIRSLSELAVNRQEPDFISAQVDQVASSMVQTERTMNELQFATDLGIPDDTVPELLRTERLLQ